MGIGFKFLTVRRKTVIEILTDFIYKEDQQKDKKQIKEMVKGWLDSYLEERYFEILRRYKISEIEEYLELKFKITINDEIWDSLGLSFFKHFLKA
ncbi:MAG: hypothetical protein ACFE8V_11125 [Promethearchaeota archaeon]